MRERHRLDLVVRDVDRRDAEFVLHVLEFRAHVAAQLGVEIGQRLVHQERCGPADDRARERHALALAAGELARIAVEKRLQLHLAATSRTAASISAFGRFRSVSG